MLEGGQQFVSSLSKIYLCLREDNSLSLLFLRFTYALIHGCMARNFNQNLDIYRIPQLSEGLLASIRGFSTHISQYHQVLGVYFSYLGVY